MKKLPDRFHNEDDLTETSFSLGETTRLLNTGMGRTRFTSLLRQWGVLLRGSEPSQRMIQHFYMTYSRKTILVLGHPKEIPTTRVTIKGLNYLQKLFKRKMKLLKEASKQH